MTAPAYLLITPARNEAQFIRLTLDSVVRQTVLPLRWVIVSDGSTDGTDEIVGEYAAQHSWIQLLRSPERQARNFAGKAGCIAAGYAAVSELDHSYLASLDADLSFDETYFEYLLQKLEADPELGIVGTPFSEAGETYDYRFSNIEHVSGACQFFRRRCYEEIGGYRPIPGGGIDVVAVLSARAQGWKTRTFTEKVSLHHRPMGSANHRQKLVASFRFGQKSYRLGYHPLWQFFRTFYQMTRRPYVLGACADTLGFFWAMLRRADRPITQDLVNFQRREQMQRLQTFLRKAAFGRVRAV